MISIKNFNPDLPKIDKKSYKNIGIYYIGYITMKELWDKIKNLIEKMINQVNMAKIT